MSVEFRCFACGSVGGVHRYNCPELEARRAETLANLRACNAGNDATTNSGALAAELAEARAENERLRAALVEMVVVAEAAGLSRGDQFTQGWRDSLVKAREMAQAALAQEDVVGLEVAVRNGAERGPVAVVARPTGGPRDE